MNEHQPKNPLHGLTLQTILETLVERLGWPELGSRINIRCFTHEPSIKSSLKFLRATPWARSAVEQLYLDDERRLEKKRARNRERAARRAFAAAQSDSAEASGESVEPVEPMQQDASSQPASLEPGFVDRPEPRPED